MSATPKPDLVAWWKTRGYAPVPFESRQLSAEWDEVNWLEQWHQPAPWPRTERHTAPTILEAVIALGQGGLVIIWGGRGAGKTFHSRLAAKTVTDEQKGARTLEISFADLCAAGVLGESGPTACQIARCMCNKIAGYVQSLNDPAESTGQRDNQIHHSSELFKILMGRFNESELRTLCFLLDIDYDSLGASSKPDAARELLLFLDRHHRLQDLLSIGSSHRPDIDWPQLPSAMTAVKPVIPTCPEEEDLGKILSACGRLAEQLLNGHRDEKVYVFVDGLDKLYDYWQLRGEQVAPSNAIRQFVTAVASGACGEHLAVRVFLNADLKQQIVGMMDSGLARSIPTVELKWDSKSAEEVAERRLDATWVGEGQRPDRHLRKLLDERTYGLFHNDLKKREAEGILSPRYVIETLLAVVNYAIAGSVGDEPISDSIYEKALLAPPPETPTRLRVWDRFKSNLRASLLAIRDHLKRWGSSLVRAVTGVIEWLASILSKVQAILLLGAVVAVIIFLAWCLGRSYLTSQSTDITECVRHAWQFLRERLPWTP